MSQESKVCRRCGGTRLETGHLRERVATSFQPDKNVPFLSLRTTVPVSAAMCRDCGLVELTGDVDVARQLLEKADAEEAK